METRPFGRTLPPDNVLRKDVSCRRYLFCYNDYVEVSLNLGRAALKRGPLILIPLLWRICILKGWLQ